MHSLLILGIAIAELNEIESYRNYNTLLAALNFLQSAKELNKLSGGKGTISYVNRAKNNLYSKKGFKSNEIPIELLQAEIEYLKTLDEIKKLKKLEKEMTNGTN